MMVKKRLLALAYLCLVSAGLLAKTVTVPEHVRSSVIALHEQFEKFGATDQFSADFMTLYDGLKNGEQEFSKEVYQSALSHAQLVCSPANIHTLRSKNVKRPVRKPLARSNITKFRLANDVLALTLGKSLSAGVDSSCCCECIEIDTLPCEIMEPGRYCLAQDLAFTAAANDKVAITIDANDVRLDLCGHKLKQSNKGAVNEVIGIKIIPEHQNIEIANGTICNFSGAAIAATVSPGEKLDTLCFSCLTITDNGDGTEDNSGVPSDFVIATGINLGTSSPLLPFVYSNIVIRDCKINRNTHSGLHIAAAQNVVVENTQVNDSRVTQGYIIDGCVGSLFLFSDNIRLTCCTFNNSSYEVLGSLSKISGAIFDESTNVQVEGCQFNDTFARTGSTVAGVSALNLRNATFKCCQFNNTSALLEIVTLTGFFSGASAAPLTVSNLKFIDCQAHGSSDLVQGLEGARVSGMMLTGKNIELERCQASGIASGTVEVETYGFLIYDESVMKGISPPSVDALRNISFKECIASDISGSFSGKNVCGFAVLAQPTSQETQGAISSIVYQDCLAQHIRGSETSSRVAGIAQLISDPMANDVFRRFVDLSIKDCTVSDVQGGPCNESAGILLESVKNPILCDNCVSDCVNGILLTGSPDANPPRVFSLAAKKEDALAEPPVAIELTATGDNSLQTFKNLTNDSEATTTNSFSTISGVFITAFQDLNTLNWKTGDTIKYLPPAVNDDPIGGLVPNQEFFLITYVPGFTDCGLLQTNKVTNCSKAGFKDLACPTQNAFICNTAFKNGTPIRHNANYCINWKDEPPVCAGDLGRYPPCKKPFNLSLIPTINLCGKSCK